MEKTNRTVRNQVTVVQPLPRLVRSNSGSSSALITTSDKTSRRFSTSERFINGHRSKSTSRVRTGNDEDKKSKDSFGKFLQRGVSPDNNNIGASKRITSTMKSPSAWALSPGRSLGPPIVSEPVKKASGGGGGGRVGGGVSKVLKYFKQRKISSVQIDEYHRFKILHNRVLQWRFINARAEVATATVNNVAKMQLFSVWIRIIMLRKMITQKRIEMQKVKHMIKLYLIMNPQLSLLNEWAKLERRNEESIARLTNKLSALSITLPLTHNLKVDIDSFYEAMNTAVEVMANIEPLITKHQRQVEKILYQVTELITASKQEEEYLQELVEVIPTITALLENEKGIRVHLIQTKMESNSMDHPYNIG
ncbi:PREDICTED: QWRF motif-containing protein 7 isoform X2 [Lupinus angustifolius]|uniref:QWRF motif-containing protein 7 isoform X2 n=1 Tax=Lupinus angustifolius TaxID=3871 RepID=UPI00092F04FD|nr:PREDICTED: QWRF motif-containing protein 7 isoform X2 [Lupinus angustifolius]